MTAFKPCIVIPVYNHADAIGITVQKVRLELADLPLILVNDGSDQACSEVLKNIQQDVNNVHLLDLPNNLGKGGAVKAGLACAQELEFTHALQLDADGQHDTTDIPRFLQAAQQHLKKMIVGVPDFDESVPRLRYYARYLTHVWIWINTLSFQIRDSMCGFRVYPVDEANFLISHHRIGNRMDFDIEILVRWFWQGHQICQLTTKVMYPIDGISHFRGLQDNVLISLLHTKLFFMMLCRLPSILFRRWKGASL